ncbi:hypothetical protein KM043_015686 [Ampulex compressa]|nr:hypothetical protein KM043_015686 [Ampulex compressa]
MMTADYKVLCTISIFCLVAVSVDRYWAILHPMGYSRTVRTKTAIGIICLCWVAGTIVGFLPLFGWHAGKKSDEKCIFTEVMDYDYLVFLYFATIVFPALLIAAFYAHIYRVVVKQLQQIVTMNPGRRVVGGQSPGTMLRLLGAARKREVKATQNLSRIVAFFIICWFPLYTINCVMAFCPSCEVNEILMSFCIILSHLNSAGNPLLYAYHLKDFRGALRNYVCRLIFPRTEAVKSRMVSVIHDRGSLMTARRDFQRNAISTGEGAKPNLLRKVTDNRVSVRKCVRHNMDVQISCSDSKKIDGFANEVSVENEKEWNGNNKELRSTAKDDITSMELQIYRPLMPLLPTEIDRLEETPPASIFVIHADVNRMEYREIVMSEDKMDQEER